MRIRDGLDGLARVSISSFKANPARYIESGALITNHGRVRAAFVPVVDDESSREDLRDIKAQLLLLSSLRDPVQVTEELRELSDSRDQELIGPAQ